MDSLGFFTHWVPPEGHANLRQPNAQDKSQAGVGKVTAPRFPLKLPDALSCQKPVTVIVLHAFSCLRTQLLR